MSGSAQNGTKANNFCWYELMASDGPAAETFYRHVIGWNTQDAGMPNFRYTLLMAGQVPVAGLMTMPPEACAEGAKPGWMGHIGVDDVDDVAKRVKKLGGKILREPEDIPGVGRFAVASDPQGAVFLLFHGTGMKPETLPPGTPGTIGWHELYAADWQSAFAFYSELFGWQKAEAMDMGPMGTYQLFSAGGDAIGGMMNKVPGGPGPVWSYYFNVDKTDAAVARLQEKGGKVVNGPMQVPGGSWIAQCVDPQGVSFNVVGAAR